MNTIQTKAFARAGLLGNPSDGFGGKTISFSIGQYCASVTLEPSDQVEIVPAASDLNRFDSVQGLVRQINQQGYYGAVRLVKASVKKYFEHFQSAGQESLFDRGFRISYSSNIPRAVGLAGSSAIIVATLRGLESYFELKIEPQLIPSLAMSVEVDELGIPAGLQDRVIQCFQGMVFMDFSSESSTTRDGMICGHYEPIARPTWFDQLFISFGDEAGQPTEVLHNDLKNRFQRGDQEVIQAMNRFAALAEQGRAAVEASDSASLNRLIDANFDLRASICDLHPAHVEMVRIARESGGSAKYCGSGGAIVGLCPDALFPELADRMKSIGCTTFRPQFVPAWE